MADSASAPAPAAPATAGERRRPTAAPGPIELSDEKTVQTLATPDSFGAPMARLSPSPTGHGYGSTPPSASTARRGAKPFLFFAPDSGTLDHTGAAHHREQRAPRGTSPLVIAVRTPRHAPRRRNRQHNAIYAKRVANFRAVPRATTRACSVAPPLRRRRAAKQNQKTRRPPQGARRAPTARTAFPRSTAAACLPLLCGTPSSPPTV